MLLPNYFVIKKAIVISFSEWIFDYKMPVQSSNFDFIIQGILENIDIILFINISPIHSLPDPPFGTATVAQHGFSFLVQSAQHV